MPFFCIRISQGSVATCLMRGGIFKHEFVANLLLSRLVKIFENRIIVSEVMAKSLVSCSKLHRESKKTSGERKLRQNVKPGLVEYNR